MKQPGHARTPMLVALAVALLAVPAAAQEPAPSREHVVRRGDTLWDLAGQYLANPFLWPMIYEANRPVVENPHWIYPGERLRIPGVPGEQAAGQVLGQPVAQQPAVEAVPEPAGAPAQAPAAAVPVAVTLDLRRPVIPEAEYYSTPWLEPAVGARVAGRVLRLADEPGTATDKIAPALHPHDRILIGELRAPAAQVGDSLLLVRVGREVTGHGQVVEPLALVGVDSVGTGMLAGRLLVQFDEAAVGDYVLRLERMPEIPLGRPQPVAAGPEGRVVEFLEQQQIYGTGDHAFVAMRGQALRLGDELAIYVPGTSTTARAAAVVPPTEVARAMVVRLSEGAATVRLTGVFDTSVRAGLPVRLVARMP